MTMGLFFGIFCGLVALLFGTVFIFNIWARKQPRHPANRAYHHDDGIPLHLMPTTPLMPVDSVYTPPADTFSAGGGDFGGGGADAGWSDSGGSNNN